MKNRRGESDAGALILFVIFLFLIFGMPYIMYNIGVENVRKQAIEAKVAHYGVNPKTGETIFVFDTPSKVLSPKDSDNMCR